MARRTFSSLEELRAAVGQEVAVSGWMQIAQDRIDLFADATGDHQWIHIDAERARTESPYQTTIAHGFLTLSLLSELSRQAVEIEGDFKMRINYGINRLRFPAPVRSGDRVRGRFTLASVEDLEGAVQVVWQCLVEIEGMSKPALAAEWLTRIYF
ncbi:MAG: MaoC family dehydratase [Bryobacterales bacterium]|nr:MaoC family dehydratase [Bryobacterales bacterium]